MIRNADSRQSLTPLPAWLRGRWNALLVWITGVSINTKIMGIVLALTVTLGLGVTLQVRRVMHQALLSELDNRGSAVASDLAGRAAGLLADSDVAGLQTVLAETIRHYPDVRHAAVMDANGQIVAQVDAPAEDSFDSPTGAIHDFTMPIGAGGLGAVRLELAETRLLTIIDATTERLLFTTMLVALAGIGAAMLLTWLITRPILDLVTTTEQLRQGDLRVRAPHWTDDEIGALSDAFNQMVSELEVSLRQVEEKETARSHLLSRLISAQEEERKRIARELHDGVGQALTSILVHIKVLGQDADPTTVQPRMEALRRLVDETLAEVRLLSRELRPSALDDLGLNAALERYVAEFGVRYPHLAVDLHANLPQRLPATLEIALYRIIQEAMTNSARHSGATDLGVVVVQREGHDGSESRVQAIIEDNGHGFDAAAMRRAGSSVGLHSMAERAELLGGTLEFESSADGTTVYVTIPMRLPPLTSPTHTGPTHTGTLAEPDADALARTDLRA